MDNIEIWDSDKLFAEMSKTAPLVVFYPTLGVIPQMAALEKELELLPGTFNSLRKNPHEIAIYSGTDVDVKSVVVLLSQYPFNEYVYFGYYSDGALVEDNIPEEGT